MHVALQYCFEWQQRTLPISRLIHLLRVLHSLRMLFVFPRVLLAVTSTPLGKKQKLLKRRKKKLNYERKKNVYRNAECASAWRHGCGITSTFCKTFKVQSNVLCNLSSYNWTFKKLILFWVNISVVLWYKCSWSLINTILHKTTDRVRWNWHTVNKFKMREFSLCSFPWFLRSNQLIGYINNILPYFPPLKYIAALC